MATISDPAGTVIAEAQFRVADDGMTLVAAGLSRANGLLQYYFGRGGRVVSVDVDGQRGDGRLATRWQAGKRLWLVRLAHSMPLHNLPLDDTHATLEDTHEKAPASPRS